ncbi:MAG: YeeE/YedE family protein [Pseudomonadota bacterium]
MNVLRLKSIQVRPALFAVFAAILLLAATYAAAGRIQISAVLIGLLAGFSLYHASFGFTAAWRRVIAEGRGMGLRYQFLLILVVSAVSFPLIAYGRDIGMPTGGFVAPVGVGMVIGALMFGFGMIFGGGCGSGTLFVAGGGSTRMCITLAFFVIGSFIGTLHLHFWNSLPRWPAWSMVKNMGPVWAFLTLALVLGFIALFTIWRERKLHGELEIPREMQSIFSGQWSPLAGVIGLAIVCILTFLFVGRPWGVTWGFALWGAKVADTIGIDVTAFQYWSGGRSRALEASVFRDTTSVMNFAIMIGALAAAGMASRFKPIWHLSRVEILTAVIGGLLMGYGARLASGCNIGAYLGGLTSGSLHGWAWMVAAFIGSGLAIASKRRLGIS